MFYLKLKAIVNSYSNEPEKALNQLETLLSLKDYVPLVFPMTVSLVLLLRKLKFI